MYPDFGTPLGMNLDNILAELRNEVQSIDEAIAALQRLLPPNSEEAAESHQKSRKEK
jgi:hypothetical protein